jgi:hypothetical protein
VRKKGAGEGKGGEAERVVGEAQEGAVAVAARVIFGRSRARRAAQRGGWPARTLSTPDHQHLISSHLTAATVMAVPWIPLESNPELFTSVRKRAQPVARAR